MFTCKLSYILTALLRESATNTRPSSVRAMSVIPHGFLSFFHLQEMVWINLGSNRNPAGRPTGIPVTPQIESLELVPSSAEAGSRQGSPRHRRTKSTWMSIGGMDSSICRLHADGAGALLVCLWTWDASKYTE